MKNDELKKKIVEILEDGYTPIEYDDGDWGQTYFPTNEDVADALIDANIFVDIDTLKDEQQSMNGILTNMSSYMNYKLHELEHRAEVAERALSFLCGKTMIDISVMVFPSTKTQVRNKQELYDYCIAQAEKEFAELKGEKE